MRSAILIILLIVYRRYLSQCQREKICFLKFLSLYSSLSRRKLLLQLLKRLYLQVRYMVLIRLRKLRHPRSTRRKWLQALKMISRPNISWWIQWTTPLILSTYLTCYREPCSSNIQPLKTLLARLILPLLSSQLKTLLVLRTLRLLRNWCPALYEAQLMQ
jgi:hypothetical protein